MIELQKLHGPGEADGQETDPDCRAAGEDESEPQEDDQRPKRVAAVFDQEGGKGKETRSPEEANPHDKYRGKRIQRSASLDSVFHCAHLPSDGDLLIAGSQPPHGKDGLPPLLNAP